MDEFYFNVFSNIAISLSGGIITALLFFVFFRPKIKICNEIVLGTNHEGREYYQFKFYNKSLFGAVEVQPTLFYGVPTEQSDFQVDVTYDQIPLSRIKPFYVAGWKPVYKKTRYAPHCVKIKCFKDTLDGLNFHGANTSFEEMLSEYGTMLELRVSLRHGLSNLHRTKNKKFNRSACVLKKGFQFEFGNSVKVKKT